MRLEIRGEASWVIPVESNEVDLAISASFDEVLKPGKTHRTTTIGNSRRAELDTLSSKHVGDVRLVGGSCGSGIDVALCVEVRFIEAHQMSGASVDILLRVSLPDTGQGFAVAPKQWNEFDVAWD